MEMHECQKCGSRFSDEELAETFPVEYPGGKNWPVSVSPCCFWPYDYVDDAGKSRR